MRLITIVITLFLSLSAKSQVNYLDLINKYENLDMYSSSYFNSVLVDRNLEYQIVDSLLGLKGVGEVIVKFKPSGIHLRRGYWTRIYDSKGLRYKRNRYRKKDTLKVSKQFDKNGNLIIAEKGHFKEKYKYEASNLVEIEKFFNPYNKDSTGFRTFCYYSAKKWIGKYDDKNRLIEEETYWDNGKVYKSSYTYTNGILEYSDYNSFNEENFRKKYIYENGLLIRIDFYNRNGRRIRHQKFKWIIKDKVKQGNQV